MKIEDLEKALQYFVIAVPESEGQAKAYFWARKGITALRSMQEAGEPLSLEQLQEMDGQPVWIERIEAPYDGKWFIVNYADTENPDKTLYTDSGVTYSEYGKYFIAYPYPPAHIDRSKWEFCLWCKDLQYLPHEMCADVKMPGGSEIGASFCPSCGRPLTEEAWAELERRVMR